MSNYVSLIDESVEIDESELPRGLKEIIAELREYDAQEEDIMYDGLAEALEAGCKGCLLDNQITERQYYLILKKYRNYIL